MKKGISLVGIKTRKELEEIASAFPSSCFEIAYNTSKQFYEENEDILKNKIASIHSLSPMREFFPNFATDDRKTLEWSKRELLLDAQFAAKVNADILVLHPGYITNGLVPSDAEKRLKYFSSPNYRRFFSKGESQVCDPSYVSTSTYKDSFMRMKDNISDISEYIKKEFDITLAIENLNPRAGYILITASEMEELSKDLNIRFCLDIGHMYITALLFGQDFHTCIKSVLNTKSVITTHIHSSPSTNQYFTDAHDRASLYLSNWSEILSLLNGAEVNMIVETVKNNFKALEDIMK